MIEAPKLIGESITVVNHAFKSRVGERHGRLLVLRRGKDHITAGGRKQTTWVCLCDCGNETTVNTNNLRVDHSKSCGCFRRELPSIKFKTHGMTGGKAYRTWKSMRSRCERKTDRNFRRYGLKGIRVCVRWLSFESFIEDMGHPPSDRHTIEREDNTKGYEPGNCVWATYTVQARNKSNTVFIEIDGQKKCAAEWSEISGVKPATISARRRNGWSARESVFTKPNQK